MRFLAGLISVVATVLLGVADANADVLQRVAGGTVGDGLSALEAPTPAQALAVDPAGNVYFAEGPRKIFVTRRISPFASGGSTTRAES
jgi:hypothetical protein